MRYIEYDQIRKVIYERVLHSSSGLTATKYHYPDIFEIYRTVLQLINGSLAADIEDIATRKCCNPWQELNEESICQVLVFLKLVVFLWEKLNNNKLVVFVRVFIFLNVESCDIGVLVPIGIMAVTH